MTREEKKQALKYYIERKEDYAMRGAGDLFDIEFVDYNDQDELIVRVNISKWQRNPAENLQGGMLCYYMDAVAGTLAAIAIEDMVNTMDMNTTFIRGVASDYIIVTAKVISIGRRVVVAKSEVRDPDNWLMAMSTVNLMRPLPADTNPTIVKE